MEGIAEDDSRAEPLQLLGCHRLDRAVGAYRHEHRRLDDTACKLQPASPGAAVACEQLELHARASRASGAGVMNIASP
jgi:hypothetical protein